MKSALKEIIESKNGIMVHFDEETKLVLWQKDKEFVVHNVVTNNNELSLSDGNYLDNMEDAMLKYLARKGKRLDISIGISENDYDDIRDNYVCEWTYKDKNSGISIDVKVMSDELLNEEEVA